VVEGHRARMQKETGRMKSYESGKRIRGKEQNYMG
jgi:hypothetical protein